MSRERHVLFRADASPTFGIGHVVRCQTLATELQRRGWVASFVSRDLPPELARSIGASGITVTGLPSSVAIDDEPRYIATHLQAPGALVVVDHYGIGADWQRAAGRWAGGLMAIDDLAAGFQAVGILLNQNLGASPSRYVGLLPATARTLIGPSYALVRPEFAAARRRARKRDGRVDRILVFMSGTDPHDVTQRAARAAAALGVAVDVVVGAAYPFQAELRAWATGRPHVDIHVDTGDMAGLMERADLAVGAPGSASWERCTLGLPTVLVTLADNQTEAARALAEAGAALDLGWHTSVASDDLERILSGLRDDRERLAMMSEAAARVTDGRGTVRVADELMRLMDPDGLRPRIVRQGRDG